MSALRTSSDALGMQEPIERRDFVNSMLLGSGGALLGGLSPCQILASDDWTGYAGVGDYARSNGNTYEVISAGHQIRDKALSKNPSKVTDTGEVFDCVIVGGGISGFAAALQLQRRSPGLKCLILENHPVFGGEAKRNEFLVDGQRLMAPQGSDHFSIPAPGSFMAKFYDSIGLDITIRGTEDRSFRKSVDTHSVLGPWLVTADEISDPGDLDLEIAVNGEQRQKSNTSRLILGVPELIELASSFYTLYPGDVIFTGTPEGVSPIEAGDEIVATIEQIGTMRVRVRPSSASAGQAAAVAEAGVGVSRMM